MAECLCLTIQKIQKLRGTATDLEGGCSLSEPPMRATAGCVQGAAQIRGKGWVDCLTCILHEIEELLGTDPDFSLIRFQFPVFGSPSGLQKRERRFRHLLAPGVVPGHTTHFNDLRISGDGRAWRHRHPPAQGEIPGPFTFLPTYVLQEIDKLLEPDTHLHP